MELNVYVGKCTKLLCFWAMRATLNSVSNASFNALNDLNV